MIGWYVILFFNNFTIAVELKKRGLHVTGTISANRQHGAPLKLEKDSICMYSITPPP